MTRVERYFSDNNIPLTPLYLDESSATVELAAAALHTEPARIAKTLAFRLPDRAIVVVAAGTSKVDNRKFKERFGAKAQMLKREETEAVTGYPPGGVCPFGLNPGVEVYLDSSLMAFHHVYPAAGTPSSAVLVNTRYLAEYTGGTWVDVCKTPEEI